MKNTFILIFTLIISFSLKANNDSTLISWKLTGRLFLDGGLYTHKPAQLHSGVGIPDIRLGAKLHILSKWYVKLDIGFAKNKVSLKDAYVEYNKNNHYFRGGYMIGFFSLEESNSTNEYIFNTATNVAETFYSDRRIGISYTRSLPLYYFSAGAFCGDGLNFSEKTAQGYNFTGRGVWRPVNTPDKLFHIGTGILFKVPDKNTETGKRPLTIGSKGVTYLASPKTVGITIDNAIHQIQGNIEILFFDNRWIFQTEYLLMRIKEKTFSSVYKAQGGYIQGGLLLKGEHFDYDKLDALPLIPTDPHSVLLVCRYNYTDLNDKSVHLLGGQQHDISIGVNYYFNKYICSKLNYSELWLDKYSNIGKSRVGIIQARLQIRF